MTTAGLSRRSFLALSAVGGLTAASGGLSGCSSQSSGNGGVPIRFLENKSEVVAYFGEMVKTYNASQNEVFVTHDSSPTPPVPQFVRGAPPDIAMYNYLLEAASFVQAGALTNLADMPAAKTIDPAIQKLVGQYANYNNETSLLPWSVTAAGVIYNKELFAQHGQKVPQTWDELMGVCEAFKAKNVTPIYGTFKDGWTLFQGLWDYTTGSSLDVAAFFAKLKELGPNAGPDAEVSFSKNFREATQRISTLIDYHNADAPSRNYRDGNAAFAAGKAAMYLQGPWGIGEAVKANPDLQVGTFPLPATNNAEKDLRCRVNLDLTVWIPKGVKNEAASRKFATWLMSREIMTKYNQDNMAFSPITDAPPVTDERIKGLEEFVRNDRVYQGAGTYIPTVIPLNNYLQELVLSKNVDGFLSTLDNDWARVAKRLSA